MRRFFVSPELLQQRTGIITGESCHHIVNVLRLKVSETILLADGLGLEAVATINAIEKDAVMVSIAPHNLADADMGVSITLYQGLPKGDKLDQILQKCTELGVERIVPFAAERSVTRVAGDSLEKKLHRWRRIVLEASRQSQRARIPSVTFADGIKTLLAGDGSDLKLLLWEDERESGLRTALDRPDRPRSVAIIIGPEGGLTKAEAAAAVAAGFLPVTLGKRILRTETAGPAVIAILQYLLGDMG